MEPEGSLLRSQKPSPCPYLKPGKSSQFPLIPTLKIHGLRHPYVADGGTASNMEGSCEYNEAAADNRQGVVLQLGGSVRCQQFPIIKK
jgi:hypothetical protein